MSKKVHGQNMRETKHQNGRQMMSRRVSIRNLLTAEQSSESPRTALMLNVDTGSSLLVYVLCVVLEL